MPALCLIRLTWKVPDEGGEGREGKGREGKGREGKGREGKMTHVGQLCGNKA